MLCLSSGASHLYSSISMRKVISVMTLSIVSTMILYIVSCSSIKVLWMVCLLMTSLICFSLGVNVTLVFMQSCCLLYSISVVICQTGHSSVISSVCLFVSTLTMQEMRTHAVVSSLMHADRVRTRHTSIQKKAS